MTAATVTSDLGLSPDEVRERVEHGQTNDAGDRTSRTYGEIIRANVFTRFNAILGVMLAVILVVGQIQDATFGIILVANAAIGIIQEIRAKRTLDRLAVLSAPKARVVRGRRRLARSPSRRWSSTTCWSCGPVTRCPPTVRSAPRPVSRSTSRC